MKKHQDQPSSKFWALESGDMTAYILMLVLGGGRKGAVPLERPSFSVLNFCSRAYFHFIMTTTKKSLETSPFYCFCRSGDHHFQNFCTCKPFHRHPRPIYWVSWTQNVSSTLRVYSWSECQPYASYKSAPETPISCLSLLQSSTFARLSMLWSPAISCSTCSKAPIFHFAVTQTYHNLGQGPSPSTLMLACKFWIKICFGNIIHVIPTVYMLSLCKCWPVCADA